LSFGVTQIGSGVDSGSAVGGQSKAERGKLLFVQASRCICEGRFDDAYALAEKLVEGHGGDYQIGLYLRLYAHTFYFLDEECREGLPHPDLPLPEGIRTRIETLMSKQDKSVMDLVKLAAVGDKRVCGEDYYVRYLREIVERFPESVWWEWAAMELRKEEIFASRNEESLKEHYTELYNFGKGFLARHPQSYLTPRLLRAMASWRLQADGQEARAEAIENCRKILRDYASAEYYCALARIILRRLLGDDYSEGSSEEADLAILDFYCHQPLITEYKKYTQDYLRIKQAQVGKVGAFEDFSDETERGSERSADEGARRRRYLPWLVMAGLGVVVGVIILVLSARRRG